MTVQFEEEKRNMVALHSQKLEGLQEKIELTLQEKWESKSLEVVKDQALISNAHLRKGQLGYLSQTDRFWNHASQGIMVLLDLVQQRNCMKKSCPHCNR